MSLTSQLLFFFFFSFFSSFPIFATIALSSSAARLLIGDHLTVTEPSPLEDFFIISFLPRPQIVVVLPLTLFFFACCRGESCDFPTWHPARYGWDISTLCHPGLSVSQTSLSLGSYLRVSVFRFAHQG